ncbi:MULTISPECIES: hypothetical protein [unclassified Solwaraspora]|uniref:hypothetical protein n=1 Tax=unclassified Solwaraspora TaxID=2627926 RepID=UPI00248BB8E5|nr:MULTISPECIES: hypothetical protein [unclassified Solwaraspora]WBB96866.1 hypothetical protein O7553_26945 [Solwaraspora sp. WMMA2059]WBC19229.1 hypothetical protein O7543_20420 [Solwaraspora sp. WMMA2080]WJK33342.1 hypothetical protein O7610_21995 [Solwaraspora sp. WMMA2065]
MLGSVLPWIAGPDADAVMYGAVETAGGSALGSRAGLSGGDAFVTLLAGLVALVVAGWYGMGRARRWQQVTMAGAGVLAIAWAMLNHAEIGEPDGTVVLGPVAPDSPVDQIN